MSAQDTTLIVVDVQESFRQAPYWDASELPAYIARQQALIDGAKTAGMPIVQIFHVDTDEAFRLESGLVRTLWEITIEPTITFHKGVHSALVDTGLEAWLRANGIRRVIVSGIRTEQCCETTTRHASDLGFEVDFVTEATLTFAMTHASGKVFSAEDIRVRTELVLAGRFARIVTVEQALAPLSAAA
ncbi:nicotinamidase-related amidase [Rhizobium rosettiformans]|uniref:Isochorismatase family protein n=2 Tax=Rhizobium rosettiformans TaxID=1368430 RepID=A0A4S8Q123_9HYPH|nr:isochorismatase family protein [Rhizobium rosettiformans]MBB5276120.1 nicotinamidase-related amidase [Rhizobium rosettiformans]THV36761.1 isochorismatase family protein [Rhizobium rosettiformans W3]